MVLALMITYLPKCLNLSTYNGYFSLVLPKLVNVGMDNEVIYKLY